MLKIKLFCILCGDLDIWGYQKDEEFLNDAQIAHEYKFPGHYVGVKEVS